jgi:predicted dehydrogenase/threonine dehydrogenase-like Zn-dependent dehydrogenase
MKQVIQDVRSGETSVIDVPVPVPGPGMVLVRTAASLVSAGTERSVVEFAGKSLLGKARSRPDLVRQVLDKVRREGLLTTFEAVQNRLDQPMPLGYASAGTVVAVGDGLHGYRVGDRVACAGGGYAVHAEYAVVPQNLLSHLPKDVDFEAGAFATLGAIALHGFRLAEPQIGERVAVIGLGLLGLLSVGIARAAGCSVFGVDLDSARVERAKHLGATATTNADAEEAAAAFSDGLGCDVVLICADTSSNDPVELAGAIARDRAKVVAVGAVGMEIPRRTYYQKELQFIVSRSYGPGRYDPLYEEAGIDYPLGYVRWTEGRNLGAFLETLAGGKFDVASLISHRFNIEHAAEAYDLITGKTEEPFLAVLLTYPQDEGAIAEGVRLIELDQRKISSSAGVRLGAIGAGNFATAVLFPALRKVKGVERVGLVTASGLKSAQVGKRFGFHYATTDVDEILKDERINTVAVLTRHHLHAAQVIAALKAGKHIFCEKPLALTRDELAEIVQALERSDRFLTVGFNRRFSPFAVRLKAFFNAVNEPLAMHYRVNAGFLPLEHWLHDEQQGGGRIIGEACHFIDFLTFVNGAAPVQVSAAGLPDASRYREDNVIITLEFPDGSVGTVSYLAAGDRAFPKERVEIIGGGRVAVLDDFRRLETVRNGKRKVYRAWLRQDKGHRQEWEAFAKALETGGPPPIPYEHLVAVSLSSITAVEALRSRKIVKIESLSRS